jgi:hypothetical protein
MNPLKHKLANEWMRQEDATPEEALETWNTMEAEFKANRALTQEPRTMAQAPLANELEPGALKDEMLKDFDPSQETHEEYLQRKNLERPFNMAQGGSAGQLVQNTVDGSRPGYAGLREGGVKILKDLYNQGISHENIAVELDTGRMNVTREINNLREKNILQERDILKVTKKSPKFLKNVETLRNILEKEIKEFDKNKILPKEKYTANLRKLGKEMKVSAKAIENYLAEIKDLDFDVFEMGGSAPTKLSIKDQNKFKKNYKTKTIAQMTREISGREITSKKGMSLYTQLVRFRDSLDKKGIINKKESLLGQAEKTLGYKRTLGETFRIYEEQQKRLAAKDPSISQNIKYFKKSGEFSVRKLDTELLKFLNMETVKGSLDLRFPKFLKPSYEHIQGITPGDIIGDSEALRKVDIATRRYNFKEMGAKSNLYRDVKDYLRTAQAAIKNNERGLADEALEVVNKIYTKASERFLNLDRKDLPNYSIKNGIVKETNLKGLIEPKKIEDSFKTFFKSVADTTTKSELETIKRIQPNAFKVIDLFQKGKVNEGYNFIKLRMPSVKGGGKFAVPILAGGAALNFLTSPAEAAETGVVDKAKSWPIEHPWLTGGAATGAAATTKKGRNILGKAFRTLGTPLTGPLWASWNISDELKKGKSLTEAVTHPLTGMELAFPSLFKENVSKITKSPLAQKVLGLGGAQRFLGPLGVGITAVDLLKKRTKGMMKESDRISTLEGDKQEQAVEDYAAKDYKGYYAGGGLAGLMKKYYD